MRSLRLALALLTLGACAGAPVPAGWPDSALCVANRPVEGTSPTPAEWAALLLSGLDPATRRATSPALDCAGTQVRWEGPALGCEDGTLARTALPERPIADGDVLVSPLGPGRAIVWVVTGRFASGEALGPVALVEHGQHLVRVLASGPLRAYPTRARLRLEQLGGRPVLVAEGESCPTADPAGCARAARLLALRDHRFVAPAVLGEDGRCLAPSWLDLVRREVRPGAAGPEEAGLLATLAFDGAGLTVDEQVVVREAPGRDRAEARVLRRAQLQRTLRWRGEDLTTSGSPLWERMAGRAGGGAP